MSHSLLVPYSLQELRLASQQPMDRYHRDLMKWAVEEIERLRDALQSLKSKSHYECDDCWYSCPKSGQCCNDDEKDSECNCGTDYRNAIIDKALGERE